MIYLPKDIINHILFFDDRFVIKNGNILKYNKISSSDYRYEILKNIPKKYFNHHTFCWEVKLNKNNKYFIISINNNTSIDLECLEYVGSKYACKYIYMERYYM
jgi:predicted RNA-binding protein with PUA domain